MWKHNNFINLQLYAGETWVLNETINFSTINNITVSANFVSDGVSYSVFDVGTSSVGYGTTNQEAWSANNYTTSTGWKKEAYRTVTFDTGFDDPDQPLYKFLVANGTKQSAPTPTFKHFYDAGLQGTGTYKFRHYSQSEPSSGETWVLNDSDITTLARTSANFTSNSTSFTAIYCQEGKVNELYYQNTDGTDTLAYNGTWQSTAYKTVTFSTSPTGDLLTWLQANGTKQGGATGHTLTWNDTSIDVRLNSSTLLTSPYTMTENATFKVQDESSANFSSYIINGTEYSSNQTISISDQDITITGGNPIKTGATAPIILINYTAGGAVTEYALTYKVETGITYNILDEDGVLLVAEEVSDSTQQHTVTSSTPTVTIKQTSTSGFGIVAYGNTVNCTVVVTENDKAVITMTKPTASVEIQTGIT